MLHPWLRERLSAILAELPASTARDPATTQAAWEVWQAGLTRRFTLPEDLPPLRLLLVWDNLTGHKTPELVLWLCAHGIMPLYTPVGGSWLNMAESIQRVLKRRALAGQHPHSPAEIGSWFEQTARGWNEQPTPFVWNGKRRQRRRRCAKDQTHRLGGSGACTCQPLRLQITCTSRMPNPTADDPRAGLRRREREMAGRASSTHFGKQGRPSNGEW